VHSLTNQSKFIRPSIEQKYQNSFCSQNDRYTIGLEERDTKKKTHYVFADEKYISAEKKTNHINLCQSPGSITSHMMGTNQRKKVMAKKNYKL
jgi:hypothetical protein